VLGELGAALSALPEGWTRFVETALLRPATLSLGRDFRGGHDAFPRTLEVKGSHGDLV